MGHPHLLSLNLQTPAKPMNTVLVEAAGMMKDVCLNKAKVERKLNDETKNNPEG